MTQQSEQAPIRLPGNRPTYGPGKPFYIDKTGTIYYLWDGRVTNPGPWGTHVYRAAVGQSPELLFFKENSGGTFVVVNKELWYTYSDGKGIPWRLLIASYIDPQDTPSSTVVQVNESALSAVKLSVATAASLAGTADYKASRAQIAASNAQSSADNVKSQIAGLQAQLAALQARVSAFPSQGVSTQQVADLVWAKLWDVIYTLRLGMNAGLSKDPNIQGWIHDLTSFIKKVK
jgi:hypothetical protein